MQRLFEPGSDKFREMKLTVEQIAVALPERRVTNEELQRLNPEWDLSTAGLRAGVQSRYWAGEDETAVDLAYRACRQLFREHPQLETRVDGLIFCTQTPDYFLPANACVLHQRLGLTESVFAFDLAMGCSGFINGLSLAQGLVHSGQLGNPLLVTADTLSKRVNRADLSNRVLFGDGAAVSWLTAAEEGRGLLDIECATAGRHFDKIIIPAGGCRLPQAEETSRPQSDEKGNVRSSQDLSMDGLGVFGFFESRVPQQIRKLLNRNGVSLDQVDFFLFHQASKASLDSIGLALDLDPGRTYRNISQVGNTVSASIPIALKQAGDKGLVKKGDLVVLSAFGVGLAWGTALLRL